MSQEQDRIRVLFVCLGNICRSPLAEGVFRSVVERQGLARVFEIDSAGTSDYHCGDAPDPRTTAVARRRGVVLDHAARQISRQDLHRFDYVIAMDSENLRSVQRLAGSQAARAEVRLLRSFAAGADGDLDVPDPYYGGPRGFEEVHDMVELACEALLEHIRAQRL